MTITCRTDDDATMSVAEPSPCEYYADITYLFQLYCQIAYLIVIRDRFPPIPLSCSVPLNINRWNHKYAFTMLLSFPRVLFSV